VRDTIVDAYWYVKEEMRVRHYALALALVVVVVVGMAAWVALTPPSGHFWDDSQLDDCLTSCQ